MSALEELRHVLPLEGQASLLADDVLYSRVHDLCLAVAAEIEVSYLRIHDICLAITTEVDSWKTGCSPTTIKTEDTKRSNADSKVGVNVTIKNEDTKMSNTVSNVGVVDVAGRLKNEQDQDPAASGIRAPLDRAASGTADVAGQAAAGPVPQRPGCRSPQAARETYQGQMPLLTRACRRRRTVDSVLPRRPFARASMSPPTAKAMHPITGSTSTSTSTLTSNPASAATPIATSISSPATTTTAAPYDGTQKRPLLGAKEMRKKRPTRLLRLKKEPVKVLPPNTMPSPEIERKHNQGWDSYEPARCMFRLNSHGERLYHDDV